MRFFFFLAAFVACNSSSGQDNEQKIIHLPSCLTLNNGKRIKPLVLHKRYKGVVIMKVSLDTSRLVLTKTEIKYVNLQSRLNENGRIYSATGDDAATYTFVKEIGPALSRYLRTLKVKRFYTKDCIMATNFDVPITIR